MTVAPREIADARLLAMDHAGWLEDFARLVMQTADVARDPAKAPQRLGMATRLRWAARVIVLLQAEIVSLEARLRRAEEEAKVLRAELEALAGAGRQAMPAAQPANQKGADNEPEPGH